jgi:hypothetical protein
MGALHRNVDVLGAGFRDNGKRLTGCRIDECRGAPRKRGHAFAVDEEIFYLIGFVHEALGFGMFNFKFQLLELAKDTQIWLKSQDANDTDFTLTILSKNAIFEYDLKFFKVYYEKKNLLLRRCPHYIPHGV